MMLTPTSTTRPVWTRSRGLLLAIVATVAVPLVLHLVHLDLLMLPLLLVATASLLRSGEGLLDRLFLAGIAVLGGLLAAGLVLSMWPWGLQPLAVAWFASATLLIVGVASGRRPELPSAVDWSDLVILGSGAVAFAAAYRPVWHLDAAQRLNLTVLNLDRAAQFALYQTVRRLGGYAFLNPQQARVSVRTPTETVYPQGSHYLLALTNSFLTRGGRVLGGAIDLSRYVDLVFAVYALLVATIVWSVRWVAGNGTSGWVRSVLCLVAAAFALLGPLAEIIPTNGDAQIFGLVVVVLAAALAFRPTVNRRDYLVLVGALLVGSFYTYNLYGPLVGLALVLALVLHRFPLRTERKAIVWILVPCLGIALVPTILTMLSRLSLQDQATIAGRHIPLSNWLPVSVAVLGAIPLLRRQEQAHTLRRGYLSVAIAVAVAVGAFAEYQHLAGHGNSYYLPKMTCAGYVALLPALGALALLWQPSKRAPQLSDTRLAGHAQTRLSFGSLAVGVRVVGAVGLTLLAAWVSVVQQWLPGTATSPGGASYIPLARWSDGHQRTAYPAIYPALAQRGILNDPIPTIVDAGGTPALNRAVTFFVGSMNGQLGRIDPAFSTLMQPVFDTSGKRLGGQPPASVIAAARAVGGTVRVVAPTDAVAEQLRAAAVGDPSLNLSIVTVDMRRLQH